MVASFAIFAIDETKSASAHQQQAVNGETAPLSGHPASTGSRKGAVHEAIDEAADTFTSPFASIVSSSSSEWASRIVKLLLALAVYGFGLGYLARMIRVRV